MLHARQFVTRILEHLQKLADHDLAGWQIIRKRSVQRHGFLHHASETIERAELFQENIKKCNCVNGSGEGRTLIALGAVHLRRVDPLQH